MVQEEQHVQPFGCVCLGKPRTGISELERSGAGRTQSSFARRFSTRLSTSLFSFRKKGSRGRHAQASLARDTSQYLSAVPGQDVEAPPRTSTVSEPPCELRSTSDPDSVKCDASATDVPLLVSVGRAGERGAPQPQHEGADEQPHSATNASAAAIDVRNDDSGFSSSPVADIASAVERHSAPQPGPQPGPNRPPWVDDHCSDSDAGPDVARPHREDTTTIASSAHSLGRSAEASLDVWGARNRRNESDERTGEIETDPEAERGDQGSAAQLQHHERVCASAVASSLSAASLRKSLAGPAQAERTESLQSVDKVLAHMLGDVLESERSGSVTPWGSERKRHDSGTLTEASAALLEGAAAGSRAASSALCISRPLCMDDASAGALTSQQSAQSVDDLLAGMLDELDHCDEVGPSAADEGCSGEHNTADDDHPAPIDESRQLGCSEVVALDFGEQQGVAPCIPCASPSSRASSRPLGAVPEMHNQQSLADSANLGLADPQQMSLQLSEPESLAILRAPQPRAVAWPRSASLDGSQQLPSDAAAAPRSEAAASMPPRAAPQRAPEYVVSVDNHAFESSESNMHAASPDGLALQSPLVQRLVQRAQYAIRSRSATTMRAAAAAAAAALESPAAIPHLHHQCGHALAILRHTIERVLPPPEHGALAASEYTLHNLCWDATFSVLSAALEDEPEALAVLASAAAPLATFRFVAALLADHGARATGHVSDSLCDLGLAAALAFVAALLAVSAVLPVAERAPAVAYHPVQTLPATAGLHTAAGSVAVTADDESFVSLTLVPPAAVDLVSKSPNGPGLRMGRAPSTIMLSIARIIVAHHVDANGDAISGHDAAGRDAAVPPVPKFLATPAAEHSAAAQALVQKTRSFESLRAPAVPDDGFRAQRARNRRASMASRRTSMASRRTSMASRRGSMSSRRASFSQPGPAAAHLPKPPSHALLSGLLPRATSVADSEATKAATPRPMSLAAGSATGTIAPYTARTEDMSAAASSATEELPDAPDFYADHDTWTDFTHDDFTAMAGTREPSHASLPISQMFAHVGHNQFASHVVPASAGTSMMSDEQGPGLCDLVAYKLMDQASHVSITDSFVSAAVDEVDDGAAAGGGLPSGWGIGWLRRRGAPASNPFTAEIVQSMSADILADALGPIALPDVANIDHTLYGLPPANICERVPEEETELGQEGALKPGTENVADGPLSVRRSLAKGLPNTLAAHVQQLNTMSHPVQAGSVAGTEATASMAASYTYDASVTASSMDVQEATFTSGEAGSYTLHQMYPDARGVSDSAHSHGVAAGMLHGNKSNGFAVGSCGPRESSEATRRTSSEQASGADVHSKRAGRPRRQLFAAPDLSKRHDEARAREHLVISHARAILEDLLGYASPAVHTAGREGGSDEAVGHIGGLQEQLGRQAGDASFSHGAAAPESPVAAPSKAPLHRDVLSFRVQDASSCTGSFEQSSFCNPMFS